MIKVDNKIIEGIEEEQIREQVKQINDRYKWTTECSRNDLR